MSSNLPSPHLHAWSYQYTRLVRLFLSAPFLYNFPVISFPCPRSFIVGSIDHPDEGWIDGTAIVIAILLVRYVFIAREFSLLLAVEVCLSSF